MTMHLEVDYVPGRNQYFWNISDGPDGVDTHEGIADTLTKVIEQVTKWRSLNSLHYL